MAGTTFSSDLEKRVSFERFKRRGGVCCRSQDCWRRWLAASNNQQSRKGQRLTMSCWKNFITNIEDIEKEIDGMKNKYDITTKIHLGGNTFVKTPYRCVNLRKFRDGTIPTQEGLSLKFGQWQHMIRRLGEIHFKLPVDIDTVIPCQLSEDHKNQLWMLRFPEWNSNGFESYSDY